jgi:molybdate-binding protein
MPTAILPLPPVLRDAPDLRDALLVAFVRREQGLVLPPGNPKRLRGLSDVLALGARMAMRQRSYFRPTMQALIRFLSEKGCGSPPRS